MYYNANKNIIMIALSRAVLSSTYTDDLIGRHQSPGRQDFENRAFENGDDACNIFNIHTHSDALLPCGGFCPVSGMLLSLCSLSHTTTVSHTPATSAQGVPERVPWVCSAFFYLIQLAAGPLLLSS